MKWECIFPPNRLGIAGGEDNKSFMKGPVSGFVGDIPLPRFKAKFKGII